MPTSSITHNFVISDPAAVERFANALEESAKDKKRYPFQPVKNAVFLTDPEEIAALLERRKRTKEERKWANGQG